MQELEFHPIANAFPLIPDADLQRLANDIKASGLLVPIVLYEKKILDGRNRYRACKLAGTTPAFTEYEGTTPTKFVISHNGNRRDLTKSMRAVVALTLMPWCVEEAKGRKGNNQHTSLVELIPPSERAKARDEAGEAMGVSGRYVDEAASILEEAPEEFEAIKRGEKTITEVRRELNRRRAIEKVTDLPTGKFRVIYADPPWKYGDSRDKLEGTTGARAHYPEQTIAELCDMPIAGIAANDAVLFLWVTSPLLYEAAAVIKAWGFEYKTSFVWDKVKHNMGHYNSVRHEFLLVCTRGSCTPDVKKLFDSVVSIERGPKHSEKPSKFRTMIDTIYSKGSRIELFARGKAVKGWKNWGSENLNATER